MITLYTRTSSASSRNAKQWLIDHNIVFTEKKITQHSTWKCEELQNILQYTENGFDSIIAKRSATYPGDDEINKMSTRELITYLINNPYLVKFPIIIDNTKLVIGYNKEKIRVFITREKRQMNLFEITGGLLRCKSILTSSSIDPAMRTYKVVL